MSLKTTTLNAKKNATTAKLQVENRRMEERLQVLKRMMSAEKAKRELDGGIHWQSGKAGPLNTASNSPLSKGHHLKAGAKGPVKVRILTDKNSSQLESGRKAGLLLCGQCEKTSASLNCLECIENYCQLCFAKIHRKGALSRHHIKPIAQKVKEVSPKSSLSKLPTAQQKYEHCTEPRSLLDGTYDEEGSAKSFQEALNEWRRGGKAASEDSSTHAATARERLIMATSEMSVGTQAENDRSTKSLLDITFSNKGGISYFEKLVIRKQKEGSLSTKPPEQQCSPSPELFEDEKDKKPGPTITQYNLFYDEDGFEVTDEAQVRDLQKEVSPVTEVAIEEIPSSSDKVTSSIKVLPNITEKAPKPEGPVSKATTTTNDEVKNRKTNDSRTNKAKNDVVLHSEKREKVSKTKGSAAKAKTHTHHTTSNEVKPKRTKNSSTRKETQDNATVLPSEGGKKASSDTHTSTTTASNEEKQESSTEGIAPSSNRILLDERVKASGPRGSIAKAKSDTCAAMDDEERNKNTRHKRSSYTQECTSLRESDLLASVKASWSNSTQSVHGRHQMNSFFLQGVQSPADSEEEKVVSSDELKTLALCDSTSRIMPIESTVWLPGTSIAQLEEEMEHPITDPSLPSRPGTGNRHKDAYYDETDDSDSEPENEREAFISSRLSMVRDSMEVVRPDTASAVSTCRNLEQEEAMEREKDDCDALEDLAWELASTVECEGRLTRCMESRDSDVEGDDDDNDSMAATPVQEDHYRNELAVVDGSGVEVAAIIHNGEVDITKVMSEFELYQKELLDQET